MTFDYSIPIETFHRIPHEQVTILVQDGVTFTKSEQLYHIKFKSDGDRKQLISWVRNNPGPPDESFRAIGDLMDQLPDQ